MTRGAVSSFIERRGALVLFLLALIFLLPGSNLLPLLDRDEPRFARATVEMMQRGEWIIPYFNDEYRFDKPVLTYWVMRAGYAIFGVNEMGARFHSVISAGLLAVVIFLMGRRWLNARSGFIAGFGMLTCLQMAIHGRSAVADMPMVLFVCLAMWAMAEMLGIKSQAPGPELQAGGSNGGHGTSETRPGTPSQKWFFLFYVSLGLGFLAKGPIALIVPLLTAILWRFVFWRRPAPWKNLNLLFGIPITLAIIGAWGIPALVRTHGLFWKVGMGEHVIDRGMKAFNGRLPFPLYYCFTAFLSLFPWCFFVRDVWRVARGKAKGTDETTACAPGRTAMDSFLISWFLAPVLVFSFYATQLPHYIMPGFPAFFLLLVRAWNSGGKTPRSFRFLAFAAPLVFIALVCVAGSVLRPRTPALQLRSFLASCPPETQCGFYRFREPSMVFYSDRMFKPLDSVSDAKDFLSQAGPRLLIVEEEAQKIAGGKKQESFAKELAVIPTNGRLSSVARGINVAQGKYVSVRAIYRSR